MTAMLMKVSCAVVLLVVYMGLLTPEVEAVTCGQVVGAVAPCLGYLRNGGTPPQPCCTGVRGLRNAARTTSDRKTICNCLKSASSSYRGVSGSSEEEILKKQKCGIEAYLYYPGNKVIIPYLGTKTETSLLIIWCICCCSVVTISTLKSMSM
uniref:Non-specific lipid-transfer protein n=1 Tax=Lactuca sativa TaxID=4236 RepID=A0A9R1VPK8_LACSA|nr:hypothetical protein LSAT_V11C500283740 [Lactuca sativa]